MVHNVNLSNAFSYSWLNFGNGIMGGYSLEQLPHKRRERLPTEPGPTGPTATWDSQYSIASAGSTSNSVFSGRHTASTSSSLVINSLGGSSISSTSPLNASPIKSPPSSHIEVVDDLDPNRRKHIRYKCQKWICLYNCILFIVNCFTLTL